MKDETIYHIYAKDKCLYPCIPESEFAAKWTEVKAMVGLMKTDYSEEDLSYEKLPPEDIGYGGAYTEEHSY